MVVYSHDDDAFYIEKNPTSDDIISIIKKSNLCWNLFLSFSQSWSIWTYFLFDKLHTNIMPMIGIEAMAFLCHDQGMYCFRPDDQNDRYIFLLNSM